MIVRLSAKRAVAVECFLYSTQTSCEENHLKGTAMMIVMTMSESPPAVTRVSVECLSVKDFAVVQGLFGSFVRTNHASEEQYVDSKRSWMGCEHHP